MHVSCRQMKRPKGKGSEIMKILSFYSHRLAAPRLPYPVHCAHCVTFSIRERTRKNPLHHTTSALQTGFFAAQYLACTPPVNASHMKLTAYTPDSRPLWLAKPSKVRNIHSLYSTGFVPAQTSSPATPWRKRFLGRSAYHFVQYDCLLCFTASPYSVKMGHVAFVAYIQRFDIDRHMR